MKLYTEEQVIKAMMLCTNQRLGFTTILQEHLTPIELPTDEDEEKAAFFLTKNLQQHIGFNAGVKWLGDKIQGGNNESSI